MHLLYTAIMMSILPSYALNSPHNINELARNHYKLVPYFANSWTKKYNLNHEEKRELIQEGYVGFMKACEKYNATNGAKISTYSYYWIRKYMDDYVKKNNKYKYKNTPLLDTIIPVYDNTSPIDYSILDSYEQDLIKKRYLQHMKLKDLSIHYNRNRDSIHSDCKIALRKLFRTNNIHMASFNVL